MLRAMKRPRRLGWTARSLHSAWIVCVTGCGMSHKLVTAKHSTCRPSEIEITDLQRQGHLETWTATCPTATVHCTATGDDRHVEYRCENASPAPAQTTHEASAAPVNEPSAPRN